jgi:hypothetical protein
MDAKKAFRANGICMPLYCHRDESGEQTIFRNKCVTNLLDRSLAAIKNYRWAASCEDSSLAEVDQSAGAGMLALCFSFYCSRVA